MKTPSTFLVYAPVHFFLSEAAKLVVLPAVHSFFFIFYFFRSFHSVLKLQCVPVVKRAAKLWHVKKGVIVL